jgi:hypothetical protein
MNHLLSQIPTGPTRSGSRPPSQASWCFFELWAIAYIRTRYMDTPFLQAAFQIVLGGAIVLVSAF